MKKVLGLVLVAVFSVVAIAPAAADHGGRYDEGCDGGYCAGEDNRGDCRGSEAPCEDNDFSPSFDKSPVEDSFDPVICLPGSTCHFDGQPREEQPRE